MRWMGNIGHGMNEGDLEERYAQDGRRWRKMVQNSVLALQLDKGGGEEEECFKIQWLFKSIYSMMLH